MFDERLSGLPKNLAERVQKNLSEAGQTAQDELQADPRNDITENTVTKSNALARAKYGLSLPAKRVFEMLVSKMNPLGMQFNQFGTVDLTLYATEYAESTGTPLNTAYRDLKASIDALERERIIIDEGDYIVSRPLIFKSKYHKSEGHIIASFHPEFMPHLLHLSKEFTKYPLIEALKFRSQYAWRLFEMLMSVKAKKSPVLSLSVEDFREKIGIPKGYVWSDVNNTINKSISEIETKTEFEISLKKTKKGKAFAWLDFEIQQRKQGRLL
jgi:plasmid replication initiation protein